MVQMDAELLELLKTEMTPMNGRIRTKTDILTEISNWSWDDDLNQMWDYAIKEGLIVKAKHDEIFGDLYKGTQKLQNLTINV